MKRNPKQIAALVCVILIVLLCLASLVLAFCDFEGAKTWFMGCMGLTLVLPIFAWIYIWLFGKITNKKTIADLEIGQTGSNQIPLEDSKSTEESDDNV